MNWVSFSVFMVLGKRRGAQCDVTHPCELFRCLSPSIIHCKIFWFLSRSSSGTCVSMLRPLSSPLPGASDAFLQPRRDSVLPLLLQVIDKKDKHQGPDVQIREERKSFWTLLTFWLNPNYCCGNICQRFLCVCACFKMPQFSIIAGTFSTVFQSPEQTMVCDSSKRTCSPCLQACWPRRRQHSSDFWPGLRSTWSCLETWSPTPPGPLVLGGDRAACGGAHLRQTRQVETFTSFFQRWHQKQKPSLLSSKMYKP